MSHQPADQAAQIGNYQQGIPAMQQPKVWLFPSGPVGIMLKLAQSSSYPQGSRSLYSGHDTFTRCYWTYFWLSFLGRNEAYAPNATVFSVALRCGYSTDSIAG
ncbi:uncharacterized protein BO96DRAFT_498105 [Aspergillus niger CBS 101883]|uniref:uncharacterized protein n=1 Tax=Aspergillus lacticoffeatus (strain CBS 101883) TaxID=1450533 RepID=UPI000B6A7609|nr:uncharacterized protein BO96DRAFT_498105 [Aspergillus niger CBS 101883]PYH59386.1 hypothetical protein BO96DRAFT_498105 [Aspergillus niger CBS 101883]